MTQLKRIDLKIQKKYFDDIVDRKKTFELRKNDRGFKVGDYVRLNVVDGYNEFIDIQITYILENLEEYGLKNGYCIFGFKILEEEKMSKMTKDEFLKKHNLTEADYRNLQRFEEMRRRGIYNMYEYLGMMKKHNLNGGKKSVDFIRKDENYRDFLKTLEKENKKIIL